LYRGAKKHNFNLFKLKKEKNAIVCVFEVSLIRTPLSFSGPR